MGSESLIVPMAELRLHRYCCAVHQDDDVGPTTQQSWYIVQLNYMHSILFCGPSVLSH